LSPTQRISSLNSLNKNHIIIILLAGCVLQQVPEHQSQQPLCHYFLSWFRSRRGTGGDKESVAVSVAEEARVQEESKESVPYLTIHIYLTECEEARSLFQKDTMSLLERLLQRQAVCCRFHYFLPLSYFSSARQICKSVPCCHGFCVPVLQRD
jgi:hypothetical protein